MKKLIDAYKLKDAIQVLLEEYNDNGDREQGSACETIISIIDSAPDAQVNVPSEDSELLDWLQEMMTNDDDYCEIFFAGLRNFSTGKANSYQIESNPERFETMNAPTLRDVIKKAMTNQLHKAK